MEADLNENNSIQGDLIAFNFYHLGRCSQQLTTSKLKTLEVLHAPISTLTLTQGCITGLVSLAFSSAELCNLSQDTSIYVELSQILINHVFKKHFHGETFSIQAPKAFYKYELMEKNALFFKWLARNAKSPELKQRFILENKNSPSIEIDFSFFPNKQGGIA